MKLFCPECRSTFDDSETVCPNDGTRLYRLDPADDPLVGATLDDRYRIDWLIGEGGMGAVYRGIQLSVNREVAIKVLRAELSDREIALERFFREAKLVSELSHPNIVRVVDFGQDHDRDLLFLVMEMVRGVSLGDLLERGRLRVNFALELAYQVCGALTEPHAAGIVHRDLKPDNLLLVPVSDGTIQVKVLDFGIARALERNTRLTATGMICGTPAYMAPEQSRNQELDPRTDLYALGVLLYEMLAGLPPFSGQSSLQIMLKHIQEEPQRLREILPPSALPEQVEGLVHDMMSKDPDARPQSAHEVRKRIEELRSGFELDPVRVDSDLERDEMFDEWLLPSLPTAKEATRSETQALRRETGLFDHLDDDSDSEISEAATIGMDDRDKPRSEELDEVNLNDTEIDHLGPTTPGEIPVFEGKVRHAATSPGPASAWTPGPRHLVPVQADEEPASMAAAPQPSRSPTSEVSSADEASVDQQSRSTDNARPNTDKRSAVEADSGEVSTTATVLMSVAGSAVIMALFAVAGILYFESTAEPDNHTEGSPEAVEGPEEAAPADDKTPLGEIETNSTLSSATPDPEGGAEAAERDEETEDDVATDVDDDTPGSPTKRPVTEKPERVKEDGRPDTPTSEAADDEAGDETSPASAGVQETQPSKGASDESDVDRSETPEEASAATSSETKSSDDSGEVDEELDRIFESGSLLAE